MSLELSLSLGNMNWCEEMWIEIYDRAKKKGKIIDAKLGEHEFQYALINPKDGYQRERISTTKEPYKYTSSVTFWIKDKLKENGVGLNEGGLAFVLENALPRKDFGDYVGLHEHIETLNGIDHGRACKVELEEVFKKEQEFIDSYAAWLIELTNKSKNPKEGYFERAIPDFLFVVKECNLTSTQILKEFKKQLDLGYHLD
ncbi:MAG: hypothetical protein KJ583_02655 [Nanoarchaeota archaeon]|nr:hypothetical protein [Nanoarchaeota archaeon]MBU1270279.1 hypothetical protein [Nanoarchaeota archaeon]MBU1604194.1 hypothetical protein [Nanoarchaeota archaeon]MBU2443149.1 hypothetical protein [Nanoarchaeota archaeon]